MSWNNYPKIKSNNIEFLTQNFKLNSQYGENLAYGLGRSYGDVCLNENGNIIVTSKFNKIIEIDHNNGILHCESGISIKEILKVITPMYVICNSSSNCNISSTCNNRQKPSYGCNDF